MREKVGKSRSTVFFQWFGAPEGRKRRQNYSGRCRSQLLASCDDRKSARRCGAKHISKSKRTKHTQCPDHFWKLRCRKSARRCGAKHISKSKCTTAHQCRTTFGSCDVEKVHAVVARSTFPSQNVQSTPVSDHFWKLRCRKSACRCGAKHISKSKCTKHTILGPLLEVQMSKSARRCGAKHISKSKCTKHHMFAPLLEVQMSLRFTTLHYITLQLQLQLRLHNYTPLHSTTRNYTTLHYITLHYITLNDTAPQIDR